MNEKRSANKREPARTPKQKKTSREIFRRLPAADLDLATDIRTSILAQTPRGGSIILWLTFFLFIAAIIWSYFSEVEEVTRGQGRVVPSRQLQTIQNLEGGILAEVMVRVGDIVEQDQMLLRLDDTRFSAPFQESRLSYLSFKAKIARLEAEIAGSDMALPQEVLDEHPQAGERERQLFETRQEALAATLGVYAEQMTQRQQELQAEQARLNELRRTNRLLKEELSLTEPLVKLGAVSEVELLRLKRQDSEMRGMIATTEQAIPALASKFEEAKRRIAEEKLKFTNLAKQELNETYNQIETLGAASVALSDRLKRTVVRSPVRGIINQIFVNTIGGVVQPGMALLEIVPLDDTLLIQAKVQPADIAFIRPDLKATVKLTAYDFTIFGGLEGKVEHISADSIVDEQGNTFYLVNVRTDKNYLGSEQNPMPIIPGMIASVDILTGKKRILTYLMKPILRAQNLALSER